RYSLCDSERRTKILDMAVKNGL
uniref:Uncharacterized protein n=1 Tax=Amphimedon queenslandica TaxID=400682 RepID=A0A1X7T0X4_AMPQE